MFTVFEAAGLTAPKKKTETLLLRTPNQALRTSPLAIEAAGQRHRHTVQFQYGGGIVVAVEGADPMPGIKRRIRLAGACYNWSIRELDDMGGTPYTLKVRTLNTGRGNGV